MPITSIVVVSAVIFAFVAFTVVLAWGDHQTREITRESRRRALSGAQVASLAEKAGAAAAQREAGEKNKARASA